MPSSAMSKPAAYFLNDAACDLASYTQHACNIHQAVAIEACAGSGKTWILVARIFRALLEGVEPRSILAITFTKKAAAEMRSRVLSLLQQLQEAKDDTGALRQLLQERGIAQPSVEQLQRAQGLYAEVIAQPQGLQIRTFHSWFISLLQAAPDAIFERLELPQPFELLEDDELLKPLLWRPFYAAVQADADLLADYQAVVADLGSHNALESLTGVLNKRMEFVLADRLGHVENAVPSAEEVYPLLAGYADPVAALAQGSWVHAQLAAAVAALLAATGKTAQKQGLLLQTALEQQDLAGCEAALFSQGRLRKNLPASEAVEDAAKLLHDLLDWGRQQFAAAHQARMTRLARCLLAMLGQLKRQHGWIDMGDVELAARALLAEDSSLAAWMQERLDSQLRHVLIDEFQDTSPLQWQILKNWFAAYGGASAGMPSLFVVGDPKQSIYRFRNAEPKVFRAAQALVAEMGGVRLACDHTRRNSVAVLNLLNQLMPQTAMGRVAGADEPPAFRTHTTDSQVVGQVQAFRNVPAALGPAIADSAEDAAPEADAEAEDEAWRDSLYEAQTPDELGRSLLEYEAVADWLQARYAADGSTASWGRCMVLARKRGGLLGLAAQLRRRGIPCVVAEKSLLAEQLEVQDCMALMQVLLAPENNLALAQVLKSPMFSWTETQIRHLAEAVAVSSPRRSWWQQLQVQADEEEADDGKMATAQAVFARLQRWQAWLIELPVYDALFAIFHDGAVPARYGQAVPAGIREQVLANLQALLQAALDFKTGRYGHAWQFLLALQDPGLRQQFRAASLSQPDAVQLLTSHGAKGLEAEHTVLLDSEFSSAKSDAYSVLVDWPVDKTEPVACYFLLAKERTPRQLAQYLLREQDERAREDANLLYVAITRARCNLLFSATPSGRKDPSNWWDQLQLVPDAFAHWQPVLTTAASTALEPGHRVLRLPQLPARPSPLAAARADGALEQSNSYIARRGQALHRLLEWQLSQPSGTAWQQRLMQEFALSAADCAQLLVQAENLQSGEARWVWDSQRLRWAGNEVELAHGGQLLRLDRLIQDADGSWWVVDFKSNFRPEAQAEYHQQMHDYVAAVRAIYPGASVKAAWIGGDGRWTEWQA